MSTSTYFTPSEHLGRHWHGYPVSFAHPLATAQQPGAAVVVRDTASGAALLGQVGRDAPNRDYLAVFFPLEASKTISCDWSLEGDVLMIRRDSCSRKVRFKPRPGFGIHDFEEMKF